MSSLFFVLFFVWLSFCFLFFLFLVMLLLWSFKVNLSNVNLSILSLHLKVGVFPEMVTTKSLYLLFTFTFLSTSIILSFISLCPLLSLSLSLPVSLAAAAANWVMCPSSPFIFLLLTNIVFSFYLFIKCHLHKTINWSGLHMDSYCPLSNPFRLELHQCYTKIIMKPNSWERVPSSLCLCDLNVIALVHMFCNVLILIPISTLMPCLNKILQNQITLLWNQIVG